MKSKFSIKNIFIVFFLVSLAPSSLTVNDAGSTMTLLVALVQKVADIMAHITAASQEQSTGIGKVNREVTQMDDITQ